MEEYLNTIQAIITVENANTKSQIYGYPLSFGLIENNSLFLE